MYALIHKDTEKMLHVDVLIDNQSCTEYTVAIDGEIPLIHSTPNCFKAMLAGKYPEYQHSFNYPYLDDIDLNDFEIRVLYLSYEELALEEDS